MVVRLFPGRVFASGGCDEVAPPSRRSTPVICSRRVLNAAWVDHVDLEMAAVMKALFAFVPGHAAGSRAFAASGVRPVGSNRFFRLWAGSPRMHGQGCQPEQSGKARSAATTPWRTKNSSAAISPSATDTLAGGEAPRSSRKGGDPLPFAKAPAHAARSARQIPSAAKCCPRRSRKHRARPAAYKDRRSWDAGAAARADPEDHRRTYRARWRSPQRRERRGEQPRTARAGERTALGARPCRSPISPQRRRGRHSLRAAPFPAGLRAGI